MKLPIIKRKTLVKELEKCNLSCAGEKMELKENYQKEIEFLKKDLNDIINRLTKVAVVYDENRYPGSRWRVVVDLDARMMVTTLERGNDEYMIEYMGDSVKAIVIQKLTTMNIQRPETLRMGRG